MKIAFFGDSLTEGIPGSAYFKLLQQDFPQHDLLNFGKGGDTVISLHRRLKRTEMPLHLDMAFLWVGINDILVKTSWTYPLLKLYRRQSWARRTDSFTRYYRLLLELLGRFAENVVAVSPHLIGEDLDNPWNNKLKELGRVMSSTAEFWPKVSYIDLQAVFRKHLEGQKVSPSIPKSALRLLFDTSALNEDSNLRFTVDGIHLNAAGAELVFQIFSEKIREWESRLDSSDTIPGVG